MKAYIEDDFLRRVKHAEGMDGFLIKQELLRQGLDLKKKITRFYDYENKRTVFKKGGE